MRIQRTRCCVVAKLAHDRLVGAVDVFRVAGERRPAKGTFALAEERPDVRRHEARVVKGIRDALVEACWRRLLP